MDDSQTYPISDNPVFVTGSSGHVGANLIRRLLRDGQRVRVFVRQQSKNESLQHLDVEVAYGDLRNLREVRKAMEGCQGVYHVAAKVSTIKGNRTHRREIFDCNVMGTRNVLQAAKETEAGRTVVTGSFSAVGYNLENPSLPSNEMMPFYPMERTMPYERSKSFTEHECWRAAATGQEVIVATSCAVVGGADFVPSRLGKTLCDYANGKLRAYIEGGFEFVNVHDLVQGHILCMQKGRSGEKYIFSTEYKKISEIIGLFEEITGVRRPQRQFPAFLMLAFSEVVSGYLSQFHPDFPQRFTPGAIRLLKKCRHADTSKARQELGYQPTSIRRAIIDAYTFHHARGVITNPSAKPPRSGGYD
ncbi:MAG: NAD-dependent epimerase/dehydratase family protein [Rhodobacteraceae bacterium]|nr:NAD-dependent epimerase/dehydratase family protein [Paracoccaceae bacterium]MCY4196014.1 NAD-dependent epimerase/dehydratase family protein [Paracoccaceae bacterium]